MSKKILSVDDSRSIREMVSFVLEGAGHEVDTAEDGSLGLEAAKEALDDEEQYDMIITDQNMPNMDGITLTTELRKLPEYSTIPILILTTESGDDMKNKGKAAGATGWIVKPFNPDKLIGIVEKIFE